VSSLFTRVALVAEGSPIENITRNFPGRESRIPAGEIALALGALLAVIAALWLFSRLSDLWSPRGRCDSSLGLFLNLCRAHEIRWAERWLLWRLARHHRLEEPAAIFIKPECFARSQLESLNSSAEARLLALAERLFVAESDQ